MVEKQLIVIVNAVFIVQIFSLGLNRNQLSWDVVGVSLLHASFMGLHIVVSLFAEELYAFCFAV
jgi:hypothetical protein